MYYVFLYNDNEGQNFVALVKCDCVETAKAMLGLPPDYIHWACLSSKELYTLQSCDKCCIVHKT